MSETSVLEAPGGASLENTANNLAPTPDYRRDRWETREILWHESRLDRVQSCGRWSVAPDGAVGVRKRGTAVGYSGLATCGSVWACPCCNAKVQATRRLEVQVAIAAFPGAMFGAYTLRHHKGSNLDTLWRSLSKCWEAVARDKTVRKVRTELGLVGTIRAAECTYGANGWHPHLHPVHLFSRPVSEVDALVLHAAQMAAWVRAAGRLGLSTPSEDAQHLHIVSGAADAALGDYLAKSTYGASARSVGWEMTSTQTKSQSRAKASRTPWEILRSIVTTGDADDLDLWHVWEKASKGKRSLTWSKGLRALAGLDVEKSDEDLAEAVVGTEEDTGFTIADWSPISRNARLGADLLGVIQREGFEAGRAFCRTHGIELREDLP